MKLKCPKCDSEGLLSWEPNPWAARLCLKCQEYSEPDAIEEYNRPKQAIVWRKGDGGQYYTTFDFMKEGDLPFDYYKCR